jgi:hypothetical protein
VGLPALFRREGTDLQRSANRIGFCLLLGWVIAAGVFIFLGRYVEDEGWYCLIARDVWRGKLLYEDIRFTQMPLLPYLYGAILRILPPRIEAGRAISALMALGGIWACWNIVRSRYASSAALAGLFVLCLNRSFLYDCTTVRTQAATFAFACWALWCLQKHEQSIAAGDPKRPRQWAVLAGLCAAGCFLTRLSLLPLLVMVPLYATVISWMCGGKRRGLQTAKVVWAGALGLCVVIVGFHVLIAGNRFAFGIYGFHQAMAREVSGRGFVVPFALGSVRNSPLSFAAVVAASVLLVRQSVPPNGERFDWAQLPRLEWLVVLCWLAATLIHLTRKPAWPTYQTSLAWALCILTAFCTEWCIRRFPQCQVLVLAGLAVLCVTLLPLQKGELDKDRLRTPGGVYDIAQRVSTGTGSVRLLSFDSGVAFCARSAVLLRDYEMGEFSRVPNLPEDDQEYYRGVSFRKLLNDIYLNADILALRRADYPTAPAERTAMKNAVDTLFEPYYRVESYGQFGDEITLSRRKGH